MQRKKSFRSGSNDVESRLWAKLQDLNESGYQFRKGQRYRSFMLDFVEHETLLVIDLDGGSAGRRSRTSPATGCCMKRVTPSCASGKTRRAGI
jgi:very-short-patch-repair endonuclease